MMTAETFEAYWSVPVLQANFFVCLHLVGALALGLLVGYERSYHGRAAGMRTYGLLCMATSALTVMGAYSHFWYGGNSGAAFSPADVSRVMQGILTGVGFLCAGVIMKEGFSISGLTTAASLWAAAVIGVLMGVGMYASAMALALLCTVCMVWMSQLEAHLPSRPGVAVMLRFGPGVMPVQAELMAFAQSQGYVIAAATITVALRSEVCTWNFIAIENNHKFAKPLSVFGAAWKTFPGVHDFELGYARN
jgi:putative Mg2+ transporter-C (MgtC) family protein